MEILWQFPTFGQDSRGQDLLAAVQKAVLHDREQRNEGEAFREGRQRLGSLKRLETGAPRLVAGLPKRQFASEPGTRELTVKIHGAYVLEKTRS